MKVIFGPQRLFFLSLVVASLAMFPIALAQESRGSIQGKILDSTGAVIPGASVAVTNAGTNVTVKAVANSEGAYSALFLVPGTYSISVSATGFKTTRRDNILLPIHERLQLDFALEVGDMAEHVQVTAEAPLLQTANANLGVVIDTRRIAELPILQGSPFSLMYLSAGLTYAYPGQSPQQSPQALTSDTDFLAVNGAPAGTTDFTIDGIPNTQTSNVGNGAGASTSPPADIVDEFKVESAYDASVGRTSGTIINVSLKSGTNMPHGTAYIFDKEPEWNANTFFANRAGTPRGNFTYKRWGTSLSGPVIIPRMYNGSNRTFITYGYEGVSVDNAGDTTQTVPDPKNTGGDFSNLLALGSQYQIYDPSTTKATSDGRYTRQPFAGNIIPASRISPISTSLLTLFPKPTREGNAGGVNNYVATRPSPENYYNHTARVDHVLSDKQRLYVRGGFGHRLTGPYRDNWDGPATGNRYYGDFPQIAIDDVYMLSPSTVLNVRYGYIRYDAGHNPRTLDADVSSLGFPSQTLSILTGQTNMLPYISISGMANFGNESADYVKSDVHSFFAGVTKQYKGHNLHIGADLRAYRENYASFGYAGGYFAFSTSYTNGPYNTSSASPSGIGQGLAAFLLGQPTGGNIARNANAAAQSTFWSFYLHDNWRVTRKLTLDLGIRWEYEGPSTERWNRTVRGFDTLATLPITAAAEAAYAAAPDPILAASNFKVRGGLLFANVNGLPREFWDRSFRGFAPRIGLAYQARPSIVLRGGFGVYPIQRGVPAINRTIQTGFSQSTTLVPSLDGGQTFLATLGNPYPSGLAAASGSSLGTATFLGNSFSFYDTRAHIPYDMHWSFGTQLMLPAQMLMEVGYHGSKSVGLYVSRSLDALPTSYLSTSPTRDQATIDYLAKAVTNPFYGLLPGSGLNGATIGRSQLAVPYPQFTGVSMKDPQGYNWYHALQVRLERRFSHGFTTQIGYAFSKQMDATTYLNSGDPVPYRNIAAYDRPQKLTFSGILELPFGRGRRILGNAGRVTDRVIGGWQLGAIWTYLSGAMPEFGNVLAISSDIGLSGDQRTIDRWFNTSAFDTSSARQLGSNLRTYPLRFSSVRSAPTNVWDLSLLKKTRIHERAELQFRAEAFSAFNHPIFGLPNVTPTSSAFGTVVGTITGNRTVQLGLKFAF